MKDGDKEKLQPETWRRWRGEVCPKKKRLKKE